MKNIILASASPRRRELLSRLGLRFQVDEAGAAEDISVEHGSRDMVQALSRIKAAAVSCRHPDSLIIAADTIGLYRNQVIGKPRDAADARRILTMLSGHSHLVITAFTILDVTTGRALTQSVETRVFLRQLSPAEITAYIATGEPMDKAGAYAIQGRGALFVDKLKGDYYNVVGLPLCALSQALREFGIDISWV
jgi:septum formation protein